VENIKACLSHVKNDTVLFNKRINNIRQFCLQDFVFDNNSSVLDCEHTLRALDGQHLTTVFQLKGKILTSRNFTAAAGYKSFDQYPQNGSSVVYNLLSALVNLMTRK